MNTLYFDISAQLDKAFLEKIRDGFNDVAFPTEMLLFVIGLLIVSALLMVLSNLFHKYRERIFGQPKSAGEITSPRKIREILTEALEQRTKVEMKFAPAAPSRRSISCTLMDVRDETLLLELPHTIRPSRSWLEREIVCYFRIQEKRDHTLHFAFTTSIVGVRRLPGDFIQLRILPPSRLDLHQKRAFLRIQPPTHFILGVAVWDKPKILDPKYVTSIQSWGTPSFRYSPSRRAKTVSLENISAGGIRLIIPNNAVRKANAVLSVRSVVILLIELFDPDQEKRRIFWLQGIIKNSYEDFTTRNLELGIQFSKYGVQDPKEAMKIAWNPVGHEGVAGIETWVMKRHLEIYRKTGMS